MPCISRGNKFTIPWTSLVDEHAASYGWDLIFLAKLPPSSVGRDGQICRLLLRPIFFLHFYSADKSLEATIAATLLPFELVVLGVSCPRGAEADQLGRDVGETPLQPSGALPPKITRENRPVLTFQLFFNYMVEVGCPSKVQAHYVCHLCLLQGSGGPGFSSTRGITIFSAMSVSSENVGYTMKSMNPAGVEQEIINCAFQLTRCRMETRTGSRSFSRKFGERRVCIPIWDSATSVLLRSHRGEKGRPSSASLSPSQRQTRREEIF